MQRSGAKWRKVGRKGEPETSRGRERSRGGEGEPPGPSVAGDPGSRSTRAQVFTGEYRHTVDEKGRVAVPVRFRDDLVGNIFVSKWIDGCLAIHPRPEWDALATRVGALPITDGNARVLSRYIFGAAFEVELDRQGRLVIPGLLRQFAELEQEAVVVGARNHLELWSPRRWAEYSARMDDPDVLAEHLQGLGV